MLLPSQLRAVLLAQAKELITERATTAAGSMASTSPDAASFSPLLLLISNTLWPSCPATSASHVSLCVALLSMCLPVAADGALVAPLPSLAQRLTRLGDLLDKAGGALHGLGLATVLTPLLRAALPIGGQGQVVLSSVITPELAKPLMALAAASGCAGVTLLRLGTGCAELADPRTPPTPSLASDPELPRLTAEAQGSVLRYCSQTTVGAASKLLKALAAIFAVAPPGSAAALIAGEAASVVSKVLSALPPSLPYLCLLCKPGRVSTGGGKSQAGCDVDVSPTEAQLTLAAWTTLRDTCLERLTPGQLRAWLEWAVHDGAGAAKQPLSIAAAGRLPQPVIPASVLLHVLRDALPLLPEVVAAVAAASAAAGLGAEGLPVPASSPKPIGGAVRALLQRYVRLCVLEGIDIAREWLPEAAADALSARVADGCVSSSITGESGELGTASELLLSLATELVSNGAPLRHVMECIRAGWADEPNLAPAALPLCGFASSSTAWETSNSGSTASITAGSVVAEAVRRVMAAFLDRVVTAAAARMPGASDSDEDYSETNMAIANLHRLVEVLSDPEEGGVTPDAAVQQSESQPCLLEQLRQVVMAGIGAAAERLDPAHYSSHAGTALLQVHMSILNGQVRCSAQGGWISSPGNLECDSC
jgi:hypothetical protein